ncbi:amidohydrolase family protein [Chitinophaga nivalis]|uniref:Amidohydrolase family protein n=1 Tax=Chitinophaga nivalis TaxID=2991709 RepID=A0ABT3IQA3_9BACT|nr:amidohydrolase family protein [Chitinophaga nivalis]MCW3464173.1 amidohydrolase family protein [Chitinophaga nivalis]MCW3486137.1 amidohydrolase family protein [Chitinophaga nivalis]
MTSFLFLNTRTEKPAGSPLTASPIRTGMAGTLLKRYALPLCLSFLSAIHYAQAQTTFPVNGVASPREGCYAFTHATIVKDAQNTLPDATLVIREGKITQVAAAATIPADAVVVDCQGKYIYPSLIDIYSNYGQDAAPPARRVTNVFAQLPQFLSNKKGAYNWNQAIQSEVNAAALFQVNNSQAATLRSAGFGTVLTQRPDGIARGSAALVTLANDREHKVMLREKAAAAYSLDKGSSLQNYPYSFMGSVALLRQTYLDAKWYASRPPGEGVNLSLQAWNQLQQLPQIFATDDKWNVLRADKIGDEFGVQYIIKGGGNEYQRIPEMAATKATFILPLNFPAAFDLNSVADARLLTLTDLKHWELAPTQPGAFEKARIPFCLTADGSSNLPQFQANLRKAIAYGLSEQKALEALTKTPATLLQAYDQVGSLEPGKLANFLITSGPLFQENTRLLQNWIQGNRYIIQPDNGQPATPTTPTPPLPVLGKLYYPFTGYGWETVPTPQDILIAHATVWTSEAAGKLEDTDVLVRNGKIVQVGKNIPAGNAIVIDGTGKHLTPGIIDEHSHIAIPGDGMYDVNEPGKSVTAEVRVGDVVNPEDISIYRQLAGGVTTAQLLHGSANAIGGQSQLIKLRWGANAEGLKFANQAPFLKMALGEGTKQSSWGELHRNRFPQSRMGGEQVYADAFTRARAYMQQGPDKRRDLQLEALAEVLQHKRFITCHSFSQNEMLMLMKVADRFGFTLNTFTHVLEGYKIAGKMKQHGVGASTFSDWWTFSYETQDAIPYNARLMQQNGITVAINSDDPEQGRRLNQEAAKSIKYGNMPEEEALKMVTLYPAKLLHIDQLVGSIRTGKDADLVLWSDHPLSIYAKVEKTIVDGTLLFDRNNDLLVQQRIAAERNRLIQKMIAEKRTGAPVRAVVYNPPTPHQCEFQPEQHAHETLSH